MGGLLCPSGRRRVAVSAISKNSLWLVVDGYIRLGGNGAKVEGMKSQDTRTAWSVRFMPAIWTVTSESEVDVYEEGFERPRLCLFGFGRGLACVGDGTRPGFFLFFWTVDCCMSWPKNIHMGT